MADRGRPSKYDESILDDVRELALSGKTDEEIAAHINVSRSTLALWKARHPEFSDALRAWKEEADDQIEHSLYSKACGGDTTAMIFWLKNRRRETWRDRHDVEHSATGELANIIAGRRAKVAELNSDA